MKKLVRVVACLALLGAAPAAFAGGQQIAVEKSADGAALIVRTYRCGAPSEIRLSAVAEGMVDGQRRRLELAVKRTGEPGVFRVERLWPETGAWVVTLTNEGGAFVNALVELRPGAGLEIASQESTLKRIGAPQVAAALARLSRS